MGPPIAANTTMSMSHRQFGLVEFRQRARDLQKTTASMPPKRRLASRLMNGICVNTPLPSAGFVFVLYAYIKHGETARACMTARTPTPLEGHT